MAPSLFSQTYATYADRGRQAFLTTRGTAQGSGVASELYTRFFRTGSIDYSASGLTPASAELWEATSSTTRILTPERVEHDGGDGPRAAKALFRSADGAALETVWIPMETGGGRGTLCVSSQVGCAMGCAFCATGRLGLERNLDAEEIVAQVFEARFTLGWDFSSLVFMGMGEPLDNREAVVQALRVLMDPRGFAFAQDKITVCTVGLAEGIEALASLGWKRLGLSLSLNAGRDDLRAKLMPITRSNPLARLKNALQAYPQRKNFVLALNYCLLPGLNDTAADAAEVAAFARDLGRVTVNLIPYNPGREPLTRAPEPAEVDTFVEALRAHGLDVRIRGPKGRSIAAACGQLGGK